jgi:Mg2+-importing ATPase
MGSPRDRTIFMLVLGPISSVFDLATFALLWWALGANTVDKQALFQSGWFVEGLLSQTLIVHMIRTRKVPFFQSWPCAPLLFTTMVIVTIGAILPFTAIGSAIGLVRLPLVYFFWLAGILFVYCLVVQTVKIWFLKQFKSWIRRLTSSGSVRGRYRGTGVSPVGRCFKN